METIDENNDIFIVKIQNSEINEVAGILTDAFKTNPAYSLIFKTGRGSVLVIQNSSFYQ